MPPSPLLFFLPSALLFALGLVLFARKRMFVQRATRAEGTVVTHAVRVSRSGSTRQRHRRLHPIVEYVAEGSLRRVTSPVGDNDGRYQVGTPVTVLYDPERPDEGVLDSALDLHFGAILCAIVGVVGVICGFGFLFTNR